MFKGFDFKFYCYNINNKNCESVSLPINIFGIIFADEIHNILYNILRNKAKQLVEKCTFLILFDTCSPYHILQSPPEAGKEIL